MSVLFKSSGIHSTSLLFAAVVINLALCSGSGDGEAQDPGFLPEEALRTAGRFARAMPPHAARAAAPEGPTHSEPRAARRRADLRTLPTAAEGRSADYQIKLGLPAALLRPLAGSAPAVLAEAGAAVARRDGARLRLGEKYRRTTTEALEPALAAAATAHAAARAAAAERLSIKHSSFKGFKAEPEDPAAGPTEGGDDAAEEEGAAAAAAAARGIPGGGGRPARLDKKIQAYHGVLAKAVMVLALMAAGAICSGIAGVIYCWRRDANLVDGKDKALSQEARAKGKNFGRSTPQYGSYGASRGRR